MGDYDAISANALESIKERQREMYFDIKTQLEAIKELEKARNIYLEVLTEQNEEMLELKRKEIEQKERELVLQEKVVAQKQCELELLERQADVQEIMAIFLFPNKIRHIINDCENGYKTYICDKKLDCTNFVTSAIQKIENYNKVSDKNFSDKSSGVESQM